MAPPGGRPAQAHQPRGLGGDAVRGHELLLLADGIEEPERVAAEADQAERGERQQAERALIATPRRSRGRGRGEREERQQQARR